MAEGAGLSGGLSGAQTGAKLGGLLGSVVPVFGNGVGAVAGGAIGGAIGMAGGLKKQKDAKSASNIADRDPNEVKRLQELSQITKNLQSGTDALTQNKVSEVQKANAQTQNAISKVSGGDVGSTQQGLLQAQRNAQTGTNAALTGGNQLPYFQGLASQLGTRISQRQLELGLLNRTQQNAEYAQGAKENNVNANQFMQLAGGLMQGNQTPVASSLPSGNGSNVAVPTPATFGTEATGVGLDPAQSVFNPQNSNGLMWNSQQSTPTIN